MRGVTYICGDADHSHRHLLCQCQYNCGDADLSQRHLLCKRQYNCGNTDLSQRHLLCKRQYNCGDADLSQRHLLCKRQYNCGNRSVAETLPPQTPIKLRRCRSVTETPPLERQYNCGDANLSQRHLLCKRQYNCGNTDLSHRHLFCKRLYNSGAKTAAATAATIRAAAPSGSSVHCTCHTIASRGHGGDYPRRSSFRTLCVLHATQKHAAATAATIRAAAPSGSSAYCACHTKASRGHGGDYPRRSSFRKLMRTAPATQKRAAATAATIRAAALSGSSAYCACHTKARRGHGGDYPRRSSVGKLCVLRLPHKSEPRPRRRLSAPQLLQEALRTAPAAQKHSAPQLLREALRTAPATQKRAAATAATIRAAAPSGSSAYCACHTKARRGHGGDYPRRSSFRRLCVLRPPRLSAPQLLQIQEALRTAPATQKRAAATAATIRAAAPSGSSAYCACQATRL